MSTLREQKAIAVLAIEHTLLKISNDTLTKVESTLQNEYNSSISDCYDHPDYLSSVLKSIFGTAHSKVVRDVNSYLQEFTYQKPIADFLARIQ
ncbi:conserved hypothetical protein [Nitrosotalea sinensis]|uniref:Uncharacterized protein n=1 Tax=Nitrosotalea sinensis TaxID=1499975 RepID=A0A2H1EGX3_9ARCH|nr:hypothetical protein [Candidatus Nitrosotalea sinensis]SHO45859.1 conserved hypothetical protein [Candidatus Nitrosotalea sinensis]